MSSRLRALLNIHTGESRMASLVIGLMLLTSAGFTLGSTGIGTLFLTRYGVEYLPYMYLPLGIISLITSLGITALLGRVAANCCISSFPSALPFSPSLHG